MTTCPLCPDVHPEPPNVCPGRCNSAWVAAERRQHSTGQPHELQPIPGQPLWCHECRTQIEHDLREVPNLAADLGSGPLLTPPAELGRTTRGDIHVSPSPAFDLADEVTRWAMGIEDDLRAWLGHPRPEHHRGLHRSTGYLAGHLSPLLCRDPAGIAFGVEVTTWRRRLEHATATVTVTHRIPGECVACERRGTLTRRDGDALVRCGACGACTDFEQDQRAS